MTLNGGFKYIYITPNNPGTMAADYESQVYLTFHFRKTDNH